MDSLSMTAASGMRARMESLDMLANNIANSETGGYKTDREFYNIYTSLDATGANGEDPSALPVVEKNYTDFSQGVMRPTSNPLDFAIQGKGFFTVNSPAGVAYTRNGSFQISAAGTLVTADGNAVLDSTGKPIQLDPSVPVTIGADGTVTQSGSTAAQISLVDFNPGELAKQGNTMFRPTDPKTQPQPAPAGSEIQQGKLEGSNVSSSEAAVRLVSVMRQFEMMQKAITISKEMDAKTIQEVAKVGS